MVLLEDLGEALPADNLIELLSDFVNTSDTIADRQRVGAQLLAVEERPWDFLARMDVVTRVRFLITRSNPGNPRWKHADALLAHARADRLKQEFESDKGLNVPTAPGPDADANPIGLGLAMNDAGYGAPEYMRIDGRFQGRRARYEGADGSSFLYEEIDAKTVRQEDAHGLLRRVMRLLATAVASGLLRTWHRPSAPPDRP